MGDKVFWDKIEADFIEYENLFSDLRFPTTDDIERYHLSNQTQGDVASNYDAFFFAQNHQTLLDFAGPLKMLGIPLPEDFKDAIALNDIPNSRQKILEVIEKRLCTPEFIHDWGKYNLAAGMVISIIQSDENERYSDQTINSNRPEIAERCIYAFWMNEYWLDNKQNSKDDAQYGLADRIEEILKHRANKLPAWKKTVLENMTSGNVIKDSLLNLPKSRLRELVERYTQAKHLFDLT